MHIAVDASAQLYFIKSHRRFWDATAPNVDMSPDWTIMSHVNCFIQAEVIDFRSRWIVFSHVVRRCGLLQVSKREAVKIVLASVAYGIHKMWPNSDKRSAWTISLRCGCLVVCLTSSFHTWCLLTAFADSRSPCQCNGAVLASNTFRFPTHYKLLTYLLTKHKCRLLNGSSK